MDTREILTRFKGGTLRREHAVALLAGTSPVVAPPVVALPVAALPATAEDRVSLTPARPRPPPPPAPPPALSPVRVPGRGPVRACRVRSWGSRAVSRRRGIWRRSGATGCRGGSPRPRSRAGGGRHARAGGGISWTVWRSSTRTCSGSVPREAAGLDLRERLLTAARRGRRWRAPDTPERLERLTGLDGTARSVGVYAALGPAGGALPGTGHRHTAPPASRPGPAARLSRLLDLRGPSLSVDSGDSSSSTALHLALGALRAGECAAALVGAVELRLHPACQRPGAGEGVAAVLLKPLAAARADGDRVHAVIRSSAVGHPGPRRPRPAVRPAGRPGAGRGRPAAPGTGPQPPDAGAQSEAPGRPAWRLWGSLSEESSRTVAALVGDAGAVTGAAALVRAVGQLRHAVLLAGPDRPAPAAWEPARRDDGTVLPRRALVSVPRTRSPRSPAVPAVPAGPTDAVDAAGPADAVDAADTADGTDGTDGTDGAGRHGRCGGCGGCGCGAGRGGGARRPPRPARTGPPPGTRPAELVLLSAVTPAHLAATAGRLAARLSDDDGGGGRDGGPAARISPRSRTNCAWGGRCCAAVWR